jgi:hypothetical protein
MSVEVVMEGMISARAASARIAAAKNPNEYNFLIAPERSYPVHFFVVESIGIFSLRFFLSA